MTETATRPTTRVITPQDWQEIEKKLRSFFERVELICDGDRVTLRLEHVSQFENRIRVYVNGYIKGEWFLKDCPERRFLCPRKAQLRSKKELAVMKRVDKAWYKEAAANNTATYYQDGWTSFRTLKAHLIKHNRVIEMVVSDDAERLVNT